MLNGNLTRFSVSLPVALLTQLDAMVAARRLPSRSRALAEMIRQDLADHDAQAPRRILAGTITLVYDNRRGLLRDQLARIQRRHLKEVISSQHVFLEEDHSLEVLLVQGPGQSLNRLADQLRGVKGVKQVQLVLTARVLPPLH